MKSHGSTKVGSYAKKQLGGLNFFLTWSHGARFRRAVAYTKVFKPNKLLDFGCGDATFLYLLGSRVLERFGYDSNEKQLDECRARYDSDIHFLNASELEDKKFKSYFDLILCMEVLEHCTVEQRFQIYKSLEEKISNMGRVVFSVPIEIGPALLFKHLVRLLLAIKNVEHYKYREKYTFAEFFKMLFATKHTAILRPVYLENDSLGNVRNYHGHKGFNWKTIQEELMEKFEIETVQFSPLGFSTGLFSSQVWFTCKKECKIDQ